MIYFRQMLGEEYNVIEATDGTERGKSCRAKART